MSQSLFTGATGLLAHQKKLDVVANNLANLNTSGYKAQQIVFSDLVYTTLAGASGGTTGNIGGTNPKQVGYGVQVAQTTRNQTQGVLSSTGSMMDFAIEGDGYFVVSDGNPKFTRAGSFSLDENGFLVDPSTGAYVQRFGAVGEGIGGDPVFQDPTSANIHVPLGASIEGRQTTEAKMTGNLPASFGLPQEHVLTTIRPLEASGTGATSTTLLNDLDSNSTDYIVGDSLVIQGSDTDGAPINSNFAVDGTTTVNDLINHINSILTGATAALNADSTISITADDVGESSLTLTLADDTGNTGASDYSAHSFATTTTGKLGDMVETTLQVYDLRGEPHTVKASFEKKDNNIWDATFDLIDGSGNMIDSAIETIEFSESGVFQAVQGNGDGDGDITFDFDSLVDDQTVVINLSSLTHMATSYSASFNQDGYPPGNITAVSANADGVLEGIATNGQRVPIAQLAIATFLNVGGLDAVGQSYFMASANSGDPQIGAGATGAAGFVRSRQLEASNVDVAFEFTQLIVAQRGFSANARTITVASEVLEELTNIIR